MNVEKWEGFKCQVRRFIQFLFNWLWSFGRFAREVVLRLCVECLGELNVVIFFFCRNYLRSSFCIVVVCGVRRSMVVIVWLRVCGCRNYTQGIGWFLNIWAFISWVWVFVSGRFRFVALFMLCFVWFGKGVLLGNGGGEEKGVVWVEIMRES